MKTNGTVTPGAMLHLGENYRADQVNQRGRQLADLKKIKVKAKIKEAQLGLLTNLLETKYDLLMHFDRYGREIEPHVRDNLMRTAMKERCRYLNSSGVQIKLRLPRVGLYDATTKKLLRWVDRLTSSKNDRAGTYRATAKGMYGERVALRYHAFCLAPWVSQGILAACEAGRRDLVVLFIKMAVAEFIPFFEKLTGLEVVAVPVHPKDMAFHFQPSFVCINAQKEKIGTFNFPNLGPALLGVSRLRDFGMTPEEIDRVTGRKGALEGLDHFIERRGGPGGERLVDLQVQKFLDATSERLIRTPVLAELAEFFEKGRQAYRRMKGEDLRLAAEAEQEIVEAEEMLAEAEIERFAAEVQGDIDVDEERARKAKVEKEKEQDRIRLELARKEAEEAKSRVALAEVELQTTLRTLDGIRAASAKIGAELEKVRDRAASAEKALSNFGATSRTLQELMLQVIFSKIGLADKNEEFPDALQGKLVLRESRAGRFFVLSDSAVIQLQGLSKGADKLLADRSNIIITLDMVTKAKVGEQLNYSLATASMMKLHTLVSAESKLFRPEDLCWLGPKVLSLATADSGMESSKEFMIERNGLCELTRGNPLFEKAFLEDVPFDLFSGKLHHVPNPGPAQSKAIQKPLRNPREMEM